jgi:hypothetical protein
MLGTKKREAETATEEFLGKVIQDPGFKEFVKNKFAVGQSTMISDSDIDAELSSKENDDESIISI